MICSPVWCGFMLSMKLQNMKSMLRRHRQRRSAAMPRAVNATTHGNSPDGQSVRRMRSAPVRERPEDLNWGPHVWASCCAVVVPIIASWPHCTFLQSLFFADGRCDHSGRFRLRRRWHAGRARIWPAGIRACSFPSFRWSLLPMSLRGRRFRNLAPFGIPNRQLVFLPLQSGRHLRHDRCGVFDLHRALCCLCGILEAPGAGEYFMRLSMALFGPHGAGRVR